MCDYCRYVQYLQFDPYKVANKPLDQKLRALEGGETYKVIMSVAVVLRIRKYRRYQVNLRRKYTRKMYVKNVCRIST